MALFRANDKMCGTNGEMLPGLISAFRLEPELAEVVRSWVIAPIRERARADLCRIDDADNAFLDSLVDIVPAVVLFRTVLLGEVVITDEFLESFDLITMLAPSSTSA
jgi:hypothetical protein